MAAAMDQSVEPQHTDTRRVLKQNRVFLDFFWDIAKPEQELRLEATEGLIRYLRESKKEDELKYTLNRLIEGLAATREAARPGFSLALAQVLQSFEDIPLSAVLEHILEKHNPEKTKKKLVRNAAFGNFFGVLALFQSGRLSKEPQVLLQTVQLLQGLAEHRNHLKDLPRKTIVDILSEIPEATFEEVLLGVLQADLTSAFSSPEQLHLLLVGMQRFPGVLKPKKLKKLLGSSAIVTRENIPKLVELLKTAAESVKKDRNLPAVGLDLLRVSLKEDAFNLFWREAVENGLLKVQSGPCSYMCYRLLGAALPLLSLDQLQIVLQGDVMRHYGDHVVSAQLQDRFKFGPEMETYLDSYLQSCEDHEKQLGVMIRFSTLTNQGYPVVPSFWKVVRHLKPAVLQQYIDWLKNMFVNPDLKCCLDFSTKRQKQQQEVQIEEHCAFRLRKWIVARLSAIIENINVKKEEHQVMDITRFLFFHTFFEAKKPIPDFPETESQLAMPLDEKFRTLSGNTFFCLLHHLNCLPALGDTPEAENLRGKHVQGVTADGNMWIYCVVQYAKSLLAQGKKVKAVKPFTEEQLQAWERMLETVDSLVKKSKTSRRAEMSAFQHLMLLVGIHLFKNPEECVDLLNDLQNCIDKALSKKPKKNTDDTEEPVWVEVVVEILLSLFSQPSRLMRQVCRSVFGRICPHMTKRALQLILDVLDPEEDPNKESNVEITEESIKKKQKSSEEMSEEESDESSEDSSEEDGGSEVKDSADEDDNDQEDVNENFRRQLMTAFKAANALDTEDSDAEVDDETMLALDENIASLFAEQKKRIQAKKDEKEKIRKEKILRRDFKTKVLDLIEVFLNKQPENPLVFDIIEPLLSVIEQSMSSDTNQQEQDFLRKTAHIFKNDLCTAKRYCKNASELKDDLHALLERLVQRACKQSDPSLALFSFSASMYLFKVLRGGVAEMTVRNSEGEKPEEDQMSSLGNLDLPRVASVYREALTGFMSRRKSALTGAMFIDLFHRFPIMCKQLLDVVIKSVTGGARQHQQGQACALLLKALRTPELKPTFTEAQWEELIKEIIRQVHESLKMVEGFKVKIDQEKVIRCLELLGFLIKMVKSQTLKVTFEDLHPVLEALSKHEGFGNSVRLDDTYWHVMKLLGFTRPKKEKVKAQAPNNPAVELAQKKKKGYLPETKKRKNRKKVVSEGQNGTLSKESSKGGEQQEATKKKKKNRKRKVSQGGQEIAAEQSPSSKKGKLQSGSNSNSAETAKTDKSKKKKKSKTVQATE
ncbi:myb-binding protein 1A [Ambystoma mexicanum]|uniref:myb-binding protein 1A n=1 Tax=Ambystoma mexicanum TaxID=8296 RepID=UPI0037E97CF2